jgi:hypothetical protein
MCWCYQLTDGKLLGGALMGGYSGEFGVFKLMQASHVITLLRPSYLRSALTDLRQLWAVVGQFGCDCARLTRFEKHSAKGRGVEVSILSCGVSISPILSLKDDMYWPKILGIPELERLRSSKLPQVVPCSSYSATCFGNNNKVPSGTFNMLCKSHSLPSHSPLSLNIYLQFSSRSFLRNGRGS